MTTHFPVPAIGDDERHVYVSVGHQQMMTDPMTPLGLSMWKLTAIPPMFDAGGRLFVDVTTRLASPATQGVLLDMLGKGDPLFRDALQTVLDRGFLPEPAGPASSPAAPPPAAPPAPAGGAPAPIPTDPAIVSELIAATHASLDALRADISTVTGPERLDFIVEDIKELKRLLTDPRSMQVIMAGMDATWWLNDRLGAWLGEVNPADGLAQSAPGNVTSEMGLALLDVADAMRPHDEVVGFLQRIDEQRSDEQRSNEQRADGHRVDDERLLDQLRALRGGPESAAALRSFLDAYGMRCVGEIDITRPRWIERPSALVPLLLSNIRSFEPGEARRRFDAGAAHAAQTRAELLRRLRALPDGESNAEETDRMIERLRTFVGYREFPKYAIVCRHWIYKQALIAEADQLVHAGVIRARDDAHFLTLQELREAVVTQHADLTLIDQRRAAFASFHELTPPRVLTSDGDGFDGTYRRDDVPAGALAGIAVSGGTVEGRARVILDVMDADLEPGDILVTTHTDPSWSPLFVAVSGLVTEVGGVMTHGAVIAREYGLPAVVGVAGATRRISDGQRIRVHGTAGYVEILPTLH